MSEIEGRLALFLNNSYEDVGQVDKEIRHVAFLLTDAVRKTLPLVGGGKKKWYKDEELKRLCKESQDVRKKWKDEGSIKRGLLYETKLILKRQIKKRV